MHPFSWVKCVSSCINVLYSCSDFKKKNVENNKSGILVAVFAYGLKTRRIYYVCFPKAEQFWDGWRNSNKLTDWSLVSQPLQNVPRIQLKKIMYGLKKKSLRCI